MPNYCDYAMKVRGSKQTINRVIACLKQDYNYNASIPSEKHFCRIFEVYGDNKIIKDKSGKFVVWLSGYCAWSVESCMRESGYYKDLKEKFGGKCMATTLREQSKDCEIEVFSEETGMGFSEHYLYKNGVCYIDDCVDIEICDENGNTDIDWDEYDGDTYTLNSNRIGVDAPFNWKIKSDL